MKLLAVLLCVFVSVTNGASDPENRAPVATSEASSFWHESVAAEAQKNYETAIVQMRAFLQAGGDPFLGNLRTGWIYYEKRDYADAGESYNVAARLQPTALNPLLGLLNVARAQGDAAEIHKAAENILHVDPLNYRAQITEAALQYKEQNYREALSYYRRVLQYYPDDLDAVSGEAWALYYLGQKSQAATDFQLLLSVSPNYPQAKAGLDLAQAKPATQPVTTL